MSKYENKYLCLGDHYCEANPDKALKYYMKHLELHTMDTMRDRSVIYSAIGICVDRKDFNKAIDIIFLHLHQNGNIRKLYNENKKEEMFKLLDTPIYSCSNYFIGLCYEYGVGCGMNHLEASRFYRYGLDRHSIYNDIFKRVSPLFLGEFLW